MAFVLVFDKSFNGLAIALNIVQYTCVFNFFAINIKFLRKMFGHIEINAYICIVFFMVLDLF